MKNLILTAIVILLSVGWLAIPLDRAAAAPGAFLDRSSVNFGSFIAHILSQTETVTFTNKTTAPLTISGISISGANAADFFQQYSFPMDGQDCYGNTVGPGKSCLIRLKFIPKSAGQRSAVVTVSFDAAGSPVTIDLSGEALPTVNMCSGVVNSSLPTTPPGTPTGGQIIENTTFILNEGFSYHITGTVMGVEIDYISSPKYPADLEQAKKDALMAYGLDPMLADSLIVNQGTSTTDIFLNSSYITAEKSTNATCLGNMYEWPDIIVTQGILVINNFDTVVNNQRTPVTVSLAPTSARVAVSGRVINTRGRGIYGVRVRLTDQRGETRWALTNAFGYYRLTDIEVGQAVVLTLKARGFRQFSEPTKVIFVSEEMNEVNFTSLN